LTNTTSENLFTELSRVDVSHGVEVKHGGLKYLSWSVALSELFSRYPNANYEWLEPIWLPDGTVMVRTAVTVGELTRTMQLPCLDHRNKPISNPNSFDYNSASMRCLVKNIAAFGLGMSVYLGDMAGVVEESMYEKAIGLIDDFMAFHQYVKSLSERDQVELFNSAPKGAITAFKKQHRAAIAAAEDYFVEVMACIDEAILTESSALLQETIDELSTYERKVIWDRLNDQQRQAIKELKV
jgi:hypothetical protein